MSRPIVVVDIDKTLVRCDFHTLILRSWEQGSARRAVFRRIFTAALRMVPFSFVRRRLEYFLIEFVDEQFIRSEAERIMLDERLINWPLVRRIGRYQRFKVDVILVTAAPEKSSIALSKLLNVDLVCSRTRFGIITRDLLGKKAEQYQRLELERGSVRTVYSDSRLDFCLGARKNFLVKDSQLTVVRK
jgi:hypothetical protein